MSVEPWVTEYFRLTKQWRDRKMGHSFVEQATIVFMRETLQAHTTALKGRVVETLIEEGLLRGKEFIAPDETKKSHGTCCYCATCGHDNDYCVCGHNSLLKSITNIT